MKSKEDILKDLYDINRVITINGNPFFYYRSDLASQAMEEYANQFKEQPKKSIQERKEEFHDKLNCFVGEYTHSMVVQFVEYWTEHGDNAKKMRFEKEKVFDIKKRLERWNRNQKPTTNGTTTSEALNKFITE